MHENNDGELDCFAVKALLAPREGAMQEILSVANPASTGLSKTLQAESRFHPTWQQHGHQRHHRQELWHAW